MNCVHCHGPMERSTAPFHVDRDGVHLVLDAVPAWVCRQCGEAYFEESDVDRMQEIIRAIDERVEGLCASV
jgi:YgiT-type zinc finger domain-containing protein